MVFAVGIGGIHHLHEKIRFFRLLQRGMESLHKRRGQPVDEADRIREQEAPASFRLDFAHGRVQRREQHIGFEHFPLFGVYVRSPVLYHFIQDRGFSGIGIADQGDQRQTGGYAFLFLRFPFPAHLFQLFPELGQTVVDGPAINLELRLAFPFRGHGAGCTALAVLGLPKADQPGL